MRWTLLLSKLSRKRHGAWPWAIALLLFAASLALRFLLSPVLEGLRFLFFYPSIAASTLIGGWPQGVLVLILSAISACYFFIERAQSFAIRDTTTISALISFLLVGGFIILLVGALSETVNRLEQAKEMQETSFRELQHRVANNFQVVAALLRNVQRNLRNPAVAAEKLTQAEERILAMSQLHRRLHDGTAQASGLETLLREMLEDAFHELRVDLQLTVEEEPDLSLDQLTALALLVNEAALNAAKHVFRKGQGRHFEVSLSKQKDGRLQLLIKDDGPGIDFAKVSETHTARSLGMSIMQAFATQLGGSLKVARNPGTTLSVEFVVH